MKSYYAGGSVFLTACAAFAICGCGSEDSPAAANANLEGGVGGGSSGGSNPGGTANGGNQQAGTGGVKVRPPPPRDPCVAAGTCPPGVWTNVTPPEMDATVLRPNKDAYGPGSIVGDPSRPSDLYVGGSKAGLFKSTDYGNTWTLLDKTFPDVARGVVIAVAGTDPEATVWWATYNSILKSTDGGKTFSSSDMSDALYSMVVDPNDSNHLISGLHEVDGIMESTDGGITWKKIGGSGFPSGGKSWYPYFINAGDAAKTRVTWFAIAQDGGSPCITRDGGANWTVPSGIDGLQHPHGTSQIFQDTDAIFVAGVNGSGQGVYRSTDVGATFTRVDNGDMPEAVVWGTSKNLYAMYGWACSGCDIGPNFEVSPQPGDSWTKTDAPSELTIGPNSLVVTSDGTHNIFVAVMWDQGVWRYIEP